ncbi:archaellin/type IV pilin N-terminal domain-containing protein [Natronobacterium gregoryi]|uniref:Flagellin n=2 Tax=Natronobacterium gregoryi TaxID=44930 RepID=L0AIZ9_NATGS|nr:archaellin/type IV pilin N-terminal domain-containing protein [Natronobacterium gregoryi]AFZ73122.1 archaeal flagellin-like protein [Natronobacterium gregoryi SP2]PLK21536.1 flagellin [Natronobacterium gregoryi SP2]SFI60733.1 flagellin FlaB [Natronobacterium gregoryi]
MFERVTDEEERGQVGIGTLIVFIAMVLVAAIAAGVLINTAGLLQSQAVATGEESTAQVSNVVEVNSATGQVVDPDWEESEDFDDVTFEFNTDIDVAGDDTVGVTLEDVDEEIIDGEDGTEIALDSDGTDTIEDVDGVTGVTEVTVDFDATDDSIVDEESIELRVTESLIDEHEDGLPITIEDDGDGEISLSAPDNLVNDGVYDEVRSASIMVSLGPGADAVDLSSATFEFIGDETVRGQPSELEDLEIQDLDGENVDNQVLESDENLQVHIDLASDVDGFNTIEAGDSAEFQITTADGAQTIEVLMAPSTLTDDAVSL